MPAKWQRVRIDIPPDLKPRERERVADEIIKVILDRTEAGLNKRNRAFPDYTSDYARRKGTSRGDVDLRLSGDMLGDLKLLSHRNGSLLIGFENGSKSNAKADGNITGSYGRSPNPRKARDFLGVFKKDVNELIRNMSFDDDTA